eukprot:834380-Ditylum_brightwellii.AAC.1
MSVWGGIGTGPGFLRGLNAAPLEMVRYCTGFVTSARWPWRLPPNVVGTDATFSCNRWWTALIAVYVGFPTIGGILYWEKFLLISSTDG